MDWVSFDEIKKTVSLEMVIRHYRIPLRSVGSNTLRGKCPLPTHTSKESKESFTATLTKGTGGAWACQSQSCIKARGRVGGNVLDFVAAMEKCSVRDAAIKLQTWFLVPAAGNGSGPAVKDTREKVLSKEPELVSKKETNGGGEREVNKVLGFELQKIDHAHPYLTERGVTVEIAAQFGIGFFSGRGSMQNRIVIPIHNSKGELVAYAGRSIDGSEPRYKFPAGFHKGQELFNLHRVGKQTETIILVEGFFGCMKVVQAGFPNTVALMGSSLSEAQHELLLGFKNIILLLDGDEAGQAATREIGARLMYSRAIRAVALRTGDEPDLMSEDELRGALQ